MNETWLFIWGVVAFSLSVGPLAAAAILDYRDHGHRETIERAAGLHEGAAAQDRQQTGK